MVTFTDPSSAGHEPEIQRKLFSPSPERAAVTDVVPALVARQRVHAGADHVAMPFSMAACAAVAPSDEGTDARFTRYEMGRLAGFQFEVPRLNAWAAGEAQSASAKAARAA